MPAESAADRGQATVELALVLPVLLWVVVVVAQAGLLLRDDLLVLYAAREAARVAAIDGDAARATRAARASGALDPDRLEVVVVSAGGEVTATVRYRSTIVVPLVRGFVEAVPLSASVTMHDESVA